MVTLQHGSEPVPGYTLTEKLGEGSFGVVWSADGPGETRVALKFLDLQQAGGLKEYEAIKAIKNIRHPNLLPITGFWQLDRHGKVMRDGATQRFRLGSHSPSTLVIAMVAGEKSLEDVLVECKADGHSGIPLETLLEYIEDAARGLDFLNTPRHDLGDGRLASIQHRDIKPDNILLVGDVAVLCDFGVARACHAEAMRTTGMIGSPAFISPESISGSAIGGASDQYSLALTYYYLRTGGYAVEAMNQAAALNCHLAGGLDFSKVDPHERSVLERATHLDTAKRFASCRDMVRSLRAVTTGQPSTSPRSLEAASGDAIATEIDPRFVCTTSAEESGGPTDSDDGRHAAANHEMQKTGSWKQRSVRRGPAIRIALLSIAMAALSVPASQIVSHADTKPEQTPNQQVLASESSNELLLMEEDDAEERFESDAERITVSPIPMEDPVSLQPAIEFELPQESENPVEQEVVEPMIAEREIIEAESTVEISGVVAVDAEEEPRVIETAGKEELALEHFKNLGGVFRDDVKELDLSGTELTVKDLRPLRDLPALESLSLEHTSLDDDGLEIVSNCQPGIQVLFLSGTKITSDGLGSLARMSSLERVDVSGCELDDSALVHLHGLEQLKAIGLGDTRVSEDALIRLSEALGHHAVIQGPEFNLLGGKRFDVAF